VDGGGADDKSHASVRCFPLAQIRLYGPHPTIDGVIEGAIEGARGEGNETGLDACGGFGWLHGGGAEGACAECGGRGCGWNRIRAWPEQAGRRWAKASRSAAAVRVQSVSRGYKYSSGDALQGDGGAAGRDLQRG
jgi:hypothetical protein